MAMRKRKRAKRKPRRKAKPKSQGLEALDCRGEGEPDEVTGLRRSIEGEGGAFIGCYRDPLGGHWQCLAALPLEQVKPTVFQRNLSEAHVKQLAERMGQVSRFLDPVIAVRKGPRQYTSPNGSHRLAALERLGARAVVALVVPDAKMEYQILALNTEKAHNVREKSLEAWRMALELERIDDSVEESEFSLQFEEPQFLTLGACYEKKGNFSGGVYSPVLKRTEGFFEEKLKDAVGERRARAKLLLALDEKVAKKVEELKERGLKSPYLKSFVVARINPLRFRPDAEAELEPTLEKMEAALAKLDPAKIEARHLASAPPVGEE